MVRRILIVAACAALLAGCDRPSAPMHYEMARGGSAGLTADAVMPPQGTTQQFSYSHAWTLVMEHGAVTPRFTRARDLCLHDATLSCRLVSANIAGNGDAADGSVSATLQVLLPHGKLELFEKKLLAPVGGEKPGDAEVRARSTQAQSVENQAGDTARKVAQLTAYRDRLAALAQRPNLGVEDIIRLEAEQARVQGELDDAIGRKRDLDDGIVRESLSVQLWERVHEVGPLASAFTDTASTFTESAASALRFLIAAIPWLPIVAGGIFLVQWLWRRFRRGREKKAA